MLTLIAVTGMQGVFKNVYIHTFVVILTMHETLATQRKGRQSGLGGEIMQKGTEVRKSRMSPGDGEHLVWLGSRSSPN